MAFFQKPEVFLTPPQEGKTSDHGSQPRTPLWSDGETSSAALIFPWKSEFYIRESALRDVII